MLLKVISRRHDPSRQCQSNEEATLDSVQSHFRCKSEFFFYRVSFKTLWI